MSTREARRNNAIPTWRPDGEPGDAAEVAGALDERGPDVVIDLTGYIPHDTLGLGALVSGVRQFAHEGGRPVMVVPREGTRVLLESTGIDRLVPLYDTLAEAQEALRHDV